MPINRELDKDAAHINNGILLSHKKEHNNAICSKWMDLEIVILSEVSQIQTQMAYDITYNWNPKKKGYK